jgi:ribosome biogenesis protein BRX1
LSDQISELCELHKCKQFLYFETKKRVKFSLWIGSYPYGPSFKFGIDDTVGSLDMKLQGNSLKNSRHILSFDAVNIALNQQFDTNPVWKVAK